MGTRTLSPGPERENDHPPPTSAEVKNTWVYTPNPPYVFMDRGNFTLYIDFIEMSRILKILYKK
jgi:hypothetical protein